MSDKTFKIVGSDISDGYHTFDELYDHRVLLFIYIIRQSPLKAVWKYDEGFAGWFCLYYETPAGQISYHVPLKYLGLIKDIVKQDQNYKWDGHTSNDVLYRLARP